jgi:hypothetical protein
MRRIVVHIPLSERDLRDAEALRPILEDRLRLYTEMWVDMRRDMHVQDMRRNFRVLEGGEQ